MTTFFIEASAPYSITNHAQMLANSHPGDLASHTLNDRSRVLSSDSVNTCAASSLKPEIGPSPRRREAKTGRVEGDAQPLRTLVLMRKGQMLAEAKLSKTRRLLASFGTCAKNWSENYYKNRMMPYLKLK